MDWRNTYDFVHDFFDGLASVKLKFLIMASSFFISIVTV